MREESRFEKGKLYVNGSAVVVLCTASKNNLIGPCVKSNIYEEGFDFGWYSNSFNPYYGEPIEFLGKTWEAHEKTFEITDCTGIVITDPEREMWGFEIDDNGIISEFTIKAKCHKEATAPIYSNRSDCLRAQADELDKMK